MFGPATNHHQRHGASPVPARAPLMSQGRYWISRRLPRTAPIRCSGSANAVLARSWRIKAPDAFDRVQFGGVGRKPDNGEPVVVGDELLHSGREMGVEVVPHEHDRPAELPVSSNDQVAVVSPGKALAAVCAAVRGR